MPPSIQAPRSAAPLHTVLRTGLALVALAAGWAPASARQGDGERPPSLEELLRRVREERARARRELAPRVTELARRLEQLEDATRLAREGELDALRSELAALGPEATPLLVPLVDPGPGDDAGRRRRAEEVSRALAARAPLGETDALIELAEDGSRVGRRHALELLGRASDAERAGAYLREAFRAGAEERTTIAIALARLGGDANLAPLEEALLQNAGETTGAVLRALRSAPSERATRAALEVLRRPAAASRWSAELILYLEAAGASERAVEELSVCAGDQRVEEAARVAYLDALPRFGARLDSSLRRRLEPIAKSASAGLREGALVCLALLGDRSSRRTLLEAYDRDVEGNENWAAAYVRRGKVLMRIGDHGDAAQDFERAIELDGRGGVTGEVWVDLARCLVLERRLRQAARAIEDSPLSAERRRQLAQDPDFAALVESSRYRKVLGLD